MFDLLVGSALQTSAERRAGRRLQRWGWWFQSTLSVRTEVEPFLLDICNPSALSDYRFEDGRTHHFSGREWVIAPDALSGSTGGLGDRDILKESHINAKVSV